MVTRVILIIFIIHSTILSSTQAASAVPYKSVQTLDTDLGPVDIYEANDKANHFYFSPTPTVSLASINRTFNQDSQRHELTFDVQLWSNDTKDLLVAQLKSNSVSVLPAKDLRLAVVAPVSGLNESWYPLPVDSFQVLDSSVNGGQQVVGLRIPCLNKAACGSLRAKMSEGKTRKDTGFAVEFRYYTRLVPTAARVSVRSHVQPTSAFREIAQLGKDEVILYNHDLDTLVDQILGLVLAPHTASSAQLASKADAVKTIKDELIHQDFTKVDNWNSVLWHGEDAKRPDKLSQILNTVFSGDLSNSSLLTISAPVDTLKKLGINNVKPDKSSGKILKSNLLNELQKFKVGWEGKFVPFNPIRGKMYALNVKDVLSKDFTARINLLVPQDVFTYQVPLMVDPRTINDHNQSIDNKLRSTSSSSSGLRSVEVQIAHLQEQIDELKRVQGMWPAGDYCLFFPGVLSDEARRCPDGFVRVYPSMGQLEGYKKRARPGLWLMNFACCRNQPEDLPTAFTSL